MQCTMAQMRMRIHRNAIEVMVVPHAEKGGECYVQTGGADPPSDKPLCQGQVQSLSQFEGRFEAHPPLEASLRQDYRRDASATECSCEKFPGGGGFQTRPLLNTIALAAASRMQLYGSFPRKGAPRTTSREVLHLLGLNYCCFHTCHASDPRQPGSRSGILLRANPATGAQFSHYGGVGFPAASRDRSVTIDLFWFHVGVRSRGSENGVGCDS